MPPEVMRSGRSVGEAEEGPLQLSVVGEESRSTLPNSSSAGEQVETVAAHSRSGQGWRNPSET